MHVILLVAVVALWLPAAYDMSDMYIPVRLTEKQAERSFRTFRYVETSRGIRCVEEQRIRNMHVVYLLKQAVTHLSCFLRQVGRMFGWSLRRRRQRRYQVILLPEHGCEDIYSLYRGSIREILQQECIRHRIKPLKLDLRPDHIYMEISLPVKWSAVKVVEYLKQQSTRQLLDKHDTLNYRFGERQFWLKEHYIGAVRLNQSRTGRSAQIRKGA